MTSKQAIASLFLATAVLLACPTTASAQEGEGPTFGQFVHAINPMNWRMPKMPKMKMPKMPSFSQMMPSKQEKKRVIEKKQSFVDEVSQTAKKSWTRTKNTLNPMKYMPVGYKKNRTTTPAPEEKEGGFFSFLFPKKETVPSTPNDFLKQDPVR